MPTELLPIVPDISSGSAHEISGSAETVESGLTERGQKTNSAGRGRVVVAVLAAIALGLLIGSWFFGRGDDVTDSAGEPAPEEDTAAGIVGNGIEDASTLRGDPSFPPSDDHMIVDSVSDLFRSSIDDDATWSVVYPSPMGLQILNSFGVTQPSIEVAAGFEEAARFPLISDGSTSWAINPDGLDTAYLVSTQFVVIDIDLEGRVAFINDSLDPPNIGESSFGAWGPGFDLPAGAEVLAIPRRGLFVLPSTGGTYEYEANGVVEFSDDVLVAASTNSEVFERCNATLECELYLVSPTQPDGNRLDLDVRSEIWPSPNGEWLVVRDPVGESMLISSGTGGVEVLPGRVRSVDWAADGSRAALLSDDALTMFFVDRRETVSVTLPIAPSASAVLLVNS